MCTVRQEVYVTDAYHSLSIEGYRVIRLNVKARLRRCGRRLVTQGGVATTLPPDSQEGDGCKTGEGSRQQEQDARAKRGHESLPFRGRQGAAAHGALRPCRLGEEQQRPEGHQYGDRRRQPASDTPQQREDQPAEFDRPPPFLGRTHRAGHVIKAYTNLTPAHYRAIVETAHRRNLKVHAHVYAERDVRNALEAGVDVLTHVGSAGTTPPYSPELIRDIVNAGRPVVVSATHRSWIYPDTAAFPERLQDPQLKEDFAVVPGLWEEVQRSFANWHTLGYFQRADREMFLRERGLKQFIEAGAVMGTGTDSGTPMNFHTEALWREIKAHVDLGLSPHRAISAATRIGARILGRGQDLGTIEPGKLADIVVLRRNPLFDIQALADVEVVVKDGVVYKGGAEARGRRTSSPQ